MAGILNRTARQYNLKTITPQGHRALVRVAPGFNVIPDEHWKHFVDGKRVDPFVATLKKEGKIEFGPNIDDMELDHEPDTRVKSKVEPIAKLKEEAKKAVEEAEKATLENEKLKADLAEAQAKAEKAQLELENLKKASAPKEPEAKSDTKTETKGK